MMIKAQIERKHSYFQRNDTDFPVVQPALTGRLTSTGRTRFHSSPSTNAIN
jgi:hypothetical protein